MKIELNQKELFEFAKKERIFLFESSDGFWIPGETVLFAAKQKKDK